MSNYFDSISSRAVSGGIRPMVFSAVAGCLALAGLTLSAQIAPPSNVSTSLGWSSLSGKKNEDRVEPLLFTVRSAPANWAKAMETTEAWFNTAPVPDVNSAEGVFRRLARVQALTLSAADPKVAATLRAERAALMEIAKKIHADQSDSKAWQREDAVMEIRRLNASLGSWLADSAEDRVQLFREELIAAQPVPRAEIAARHGGEAKFAALFDQLTKENALERAFFNAQQDTVTPEPARSNAVKKAEAALTFFRMFYRFTDEYQKLQQDQDVQALIDPRRSEHGSIMVPDIVAWVGEERATPILQEAYALPVEIYLSPDGPTGQLALRLLSEGKLKPSHVPWNLVQWPNQTVSRKSAAEIVALYDVLKATFPKLAVSEKEVSMPSASSINIDVDDVFSNREEQLVIIASALALSDRENEAVALLKTVGLTRDGIPYHPKITATTAAVIWDFFVKVAGEKISPKSWDVLNKLALRAGRGDELITLAKTQLAKAASGSSDAARWQAELGWTYVSVDKPDEGIPLLIAGLAAQRALTPKSTEPKVKFSAESTEFDINQNQIDLLALAKVLKKTELVQQLLTSLTEDFSQPRGKVWKSDELFDAYASAMLKSGEHAKIVELLSARIDEAVKKPVPRAGKSLTDENLEDDTSISSGRVDAYLRKLVDVLNRQGRHEEAIAVLSESPNWNDRDINDNLYEGGIGSAHPTAVTVADSLNAVGRHDDAVRILKGFINYRTGNDPAYGLLVKIEGAKALPFLDEVAARNRFEERPLIWKATLQLAAGNVEAAEATVKQAIAIDPSDGEQPKGDRMRAYSVLREVALKKGDTKQAEFLAGVVSAIRQSEDADDLVAAGLKNRAIAAYEKALTAFADAYCIQSRLARQLAAENRIPEAMEHYRRAFELMPDSFGRVESHCFGCEQAFAGEEAQSVAEKVFLELAAKPNVKPQVYYLLGYLRTEQDRWEEATDYFTKAVVADPDYLNAWKKLSGAIDHTDRPRAEKDRIAFRLLELGDNESESGFNDVRDFPKLWDVLEQRAKVAVVRPATLFPLGDKAPGVKKSNRNNRGGSYLGLQDSKSSQSPAERLANHSVLSTASSSLSSVYRWAVAKE